MLWDPLVNDDPPGVVSRNWVRVVAIVWVRVKSRVFSAIMCFCMSCSTLILSRRIARDAYR